MNTGMLWFDNDPKATLATKIERAATYYHAKYGKTPTQCFVHSTMLASAGINLQPGESITLAGLTVKKHPSVLPNHLWIGIS